MKIMNYVLAATLALLGLSCTQAKQNHQDGKTSSIHRSGTDTAWDQVDNKKDTGSLRRLESITWDSVKHQLSWDVSKGEKKGDSYQPQAKDRYEINMDTATMTVNGQMRRFSSDEAANVRTLMDFISRYALESTVWWENGEGDPVDGNAPPPVHPERQGPTQKNPHSSPVPEGKTKAIQILQRIAETD